MSAGHTLQQVLEALQQLYQNPDPTVKKGANEWLQEFQHSVSLRRGRQGRSGPERLQLEPGAETWVLISGRCVAGVS